MSGKIETQMVSQIKGKQKEKIQAITYLTSTIIIAKILDGLINQ